MMLVWRFKIMKERQLLWATFYVLCLLENPVYGEENVSSSISPNTIIAEKLTTILTPRAASSITSLRPTLTSLEETSSNATKPETFTPSTPATNVTSPNTTAESFTTQWNVILTSNNETTTTQNLSSTPLLTHEPTKPTTYNSTVFLITTMTENNNVMFNITCMKIKKVAPATEVVCLELDEVQSCENFKRNKGEGLSKLFCKKKEAPCLIELADSDMNRHCMLLLAVNNTDPKPLLIGEIQLKCIPPDPDPNNLHRLGIKSHKEERTEVHQVHSRGTLIALVTTGLLLAFFGVSGYYLMRRRSWSPMGERLGEDPYYIENDSHGNSDIPVVSQEQPDLQDKPNLNGGARENGTGQPSSKNGHQTKPQVVADTEL